MRYLFLFIILFFGCENKSEHSLVLQSDFGEKDGAVAAMRGVAKQVSQSLNIYDLTHEIPAYNIWEASYRLGQTVSYWPKGTVFVSVVDPGVGTERKSVVVETNSGHFIVTPDNGTLTHIAEQLGIKVVREIDEVQNRLANSDASYTFHGRDVYAYTGARLASGTIKFNEVGPKLNTNIITINYQTPEIKNDVLYGGIPILDPQYGNVWTNISREDWAQFNTEINVEYLVTIFNKNQTIVSVRIPYKNTFGEVEEGQPLIYLNSLNNVSFALNMSNFAKAHGIKSGSDWRVEIRK